MTLITTERYRLGEFHPFDAVDRQFIYLPAGAMFELDDPAYAVLQRLSQSELTHQEMVKALVELGYEASDADELISELYHARVIVSGAPQPAQPVANPPADFPLSSLVMNITNQCNLACTYCYEFGADKIATPEGKAKYMTIETAKQSVDFLFAESSGRGSVHITFFGGETLMNFPLLKEVVLYAHEVAAGQGRSVDFSLTTNATLLTPAIVEFLSEYGIGVTVSMDGPPDLQDKRRVFKNGRGSYARIEPRLRNLIANHRTRAITARVTLTEGVTDVKRIYRHLKDELGFAEVGFAPVTTSGELDYSLNDAAMTSVIDQFKELAEEWLEFALRGEMHGFSNVSETISELIAGVNKSHPCGAGIGLVGVAPNGDISPCHRFTDSDTHTLGHISTGIDREKQSDFLTRGHVGAKYDCQTCWARPLCAGGCHHEAFVRYGDTGHANLHYCDWIRDWTDTCLRIYGAVSAQNPEFLQRFAERKALS
ncbi:MAG: quinohemoprotein amine dehydrogenase maturation protein [Caulobacterales bacterium 68-7]|nr:MAG: quinohemoprotein amine dehydrogenase maturation protein [Caulobacterales bacterium 68-7]